MRTDLLQALQILTQLAIHTVGQNLRVLAIHDVALTIEEPSGNLVLSWVLDDGDYPLEFFGGNFTGPVVRNNEVSTARIHDCGILEFILL